MCSPMWASQRKRNYRCSPLGYVATDFRIWRSNIKTPIITPHASKFAELFLHQFESDWPYLWAVVFPRPIAFIRRHKLCHDLYLLYRCMAMNMLVTLGNGQNTSFSDTHIVPSIYPLVEMGSIPRFAWALLSQIGCRDSSNTILVSQLLRTCFKLFLAWNGTLFTSYIDISITSYLP